MNIGSLGDLAQSYAMQSRNTALKQDIQSLTQELASGEVADVRAALGGNTAYISDLERNLTKLDGYDLATQEAAQFAESVQTVLTHVSDLTTTFRNTLLTAQNSALGETTNSILTQADEIFSSVVNALNTNIGGRALFGGTATGTQPIAPSADILAALTTVVAGASSVDDILATAEAWFDDPSGFANIGYLGADTSLAPMALSDNDSVRFDLRGDDKVLRDTMRNLAIVAIAADPALGLSQAEQSELYQKSTDSVLGTQDALIDVQAQIGFSQSQIERIQTRNSAERSSLEMARSNLLSIDPFETATELEQVQFQLQSLYAITSRMSQLSLVNYL